MFRLDLESYAAPKVAVSATKDTDSSWEYPWVEKSHNGNKPTTALLLLKLGVLYWRRGNFERSEQLLSKAKEILIVTQDVPLLSQCFKSLALVKTHTGNIDDAIDAYQHAIELEPENFHLWNNLGKLFIQLHQTNRALLAFKQSIRGNPDGAIAWNGLATVYYQNGEVDEAIHAFEQAIQLTQHTDLEKPEKSSPELSKHIASQWFYLAILYTKKYQYQKAIDAYRKVLAYDPRDIQAWTELGTIYNKIGAYEKAVDTLIKAIELNTEHGEVYLNLAYAYTKLGKYQDSIPIFLKSIERLSDQRERRLASRLMKRAVCIVKKNNSVKGSSIVNGLRTSVPYRNEASWFYYKYNEEITFMNMPCLSFDLKNTKKGKGNLKEPLSSSLVKHILAKQNITSEFRRDIKTEISNPYVWNEKGNLHFKSNDFNEAIISYNRAIEIDPTFGQPYHNLALIHLIQGNYDESILLYQKSIKLLVSEQEKAVAWNGLGNVYRCKKDYESARSAYQRATELDKKNGGVYDNTMMFEVDEEYKNAGFWNDLGMLLFKTSAYDKAASAFQKAVKLKPSSWQLFSNLARTLTAQGKYKEAVSIYRTIIDLIPDEKERANAWYRLGDVHRKLNDYSNALRAYQNATMLTNDKVSLLNRARFSLLSNCSTQQ